MEKNALSAAMLQKLHNEGIYVELDVAGQLYTLQQITGEAGATFYRTWQGKTFVAEEIQGFHFLKHRQR